MLSVSLELLRHSVYPRAIEPLHHDIPSPPPPFLPNLIQPKPSRCPIPTNITSQHNHPITPSTYSRKRNPSINHSQPARSSTIHPSILVCPRATHSLTYKHARTCTHVLYVTGQIQVTEPLLRFPFAISSLPFSFLHSVEFEMTRVEMRNGREGGKGKEGTGNGKGGKA